MILRTKDLARKLDCTIRTAERYMRDMKNHYKPKSGKILLSHYDDYFAIPPFLEHLKTDINRH